jgi:hypothetical protein
MSQLVASFDNFVFLSNKLANFLISKIAEHKKSKLVKSTYQELSELSDKELRDIGISRGEIWDISNNLKGDR